MGNHRGRVQGLELAISSAIIFSANSAIAQITSDNTLPKNSQVEPEVNNIINIKGGTEIGSNLFHSFEQFSVLEGKTVRFNHGQNVQNIITRVTGNSTSNIEGTIKAGHTANLFLINPNGIIFGSKAALDIGGSFIASSASSINFQDGTKFSATEPQTTSLLTVSVPVGLQFGKNAAAITNGSQAVDPSTTFPVGLRVNPGKTLALVGGDITFTGGRLRAESGRVELGSVASNSLVSLNAEQGWALGYDGVKNFQNIQLIPRTTKGVEVPSVINTSGEGGGSIQVQGKVVTISGNRVGLLNETTGNTDGQDITITSEKLIVQNGGQIRNTTISNKNAGNLIINAAESLEISNSLDSQNSTTTLATLTSGKGNAGNISINTKRLSILNGASLSTESSLYIENSETKRAEGNAGNITVNASEIEIAGKSRNNVRSRLSAATVNDTNAGMVTITTEGLIVRDDAQISVQIFADSAEESRNLANPGQINIKARSVFLENQGRINATSESGQGGNISLQVQDVLLMRQQSQISASAGTADAPGDGGNITINVPDGFLITVPLENNDITANAFSGSGGKIQVNASGIFGFFARTRQELETLLSPEESSRLDTSKLNTSDITAISRQNRSFNGTVQINSSDIDPSRGLVELPVNLIDPREQMAANCNPGGKLARGSFTATGRGGIAYSPLEPLMSNDIVAADWLNLPSKGENQSDVQNGVIQKQGNTENNTQKVDFVNSHTEIVEAQGWVIDAHGNLALVAQAPTVTPHNSALTSASCRAT